MKELLTHSGPFRHANLRLFTWFQMFYGARAYYPVMAIFFLDLGLSLDQFVILNVVWALAIVLLEVPSGALADVIGRRKLLIVASCFMMAEMILLILAPVDGGHWLFALCLMNRLFSGLSEAAASGADQALAYDTLEAHGEEATWNDALSVAMSWRSAAFMVAMGLGGILYSHEFINTGLRYLALPWQLSQSLALRLPVVLVFVQSCICLYLSFKMKEPRESPFSTTGLGERALATWRTTLRAACWVWKNPLVLSLVSGGFLIDSVVRNFATINSQYYRLIQIPEWSFGFIAAASSAVGIFVPRIAHRIDQQLMPIKHLLLVFCLALLGLILLAPAWPFWGVLPAMFCMLLLSWNGFLMSSHLNRLTDSSQRATVLSVRGLASNLAYGGYSLAFAGALAFHHEAGNPECSALAKALKWQPWYFLLCLTIFSLVIAKNRVRLKAALLH